jgi:putative pyruvate formate lyase activating enzyme
LSEYLPSYIALYESGELARRAERLESRLAACDICPRQCAADRLNDKTGSCHSGYLPVVASYCDHHGEEPVLSGTRGSGTIFFGNCNLRCVYCQNYQISQDWRHQNKNRIGFDRLAEIMIHLQDDLKCHNINLVSPSHFVPQIVKALNIAIPAGLKIPLVYNTNSYDSLDTLRELDDIIDIYLPDLKYASDKLARKYSRARHYVENARSTIKEMYRQVGNLQTDENDIALRGLIIRHLILPDDIAGSGKSLEWLADEVSINVAVSLMSQYSPQNKASKIKALSRPISPDEYNNVLEIYERLGFENGWVQQLESAHNYLPDFFNSSHPFE